MKELKECQLDCQSKDDQISTLKNTAKRLNRVIENMEEGKLHSLMLLLFKLSTNTYLLVILCIETAKIEMLREQLEDAREMYERVKMENEVLLDQSADNEPLDVDNTDETILSMILCQSYAVESALANKKK